MWLYSLRLVKLHHVKESNGTNMHSTVMPSNESFWAPVGLHLMASCKCAIDLQSSGNTTMEHDGSLGLTQCVVLCLYGRLLPADCGSLSRRLRLPVSGSLLSSATAEPVLGLSLSNGCQLSNLNLSESLQKFMMQNVFNF
jgi:hypothetical protein